MNRDMVLDMINSFIMAKEYEMNRLEEHHKNDTDPLDIDVNKDMVIWHDKQKTQLYELQKYLMENLK